VSNGSAAKITTTASLSVVIFVAGRTGPQLAHWPVPSRAGSNVSSGGAGGSPGSPAPSEIVAVHAAPASQGSIR
jgi:hypothetical protein